MTPESLSTVQIDFHKEAPVARLSCDGEVVSESLLGRDDDPARREARGKPISSASAIVRLRQSHTFLTDARTRWLGSRECQRTRRASAMSYDLQSQEDQTCLEPFECRCENIVVHDSRFHGVRYRSDELRYVLEVAVQAFHGIWRHSLDCQGN